MAAEKVERNYDLLFHMLVRLPPKSVFKFRCVSKRWNNIFLHPSFLKSYNKIEREEQSRPGGGCLLAFRDELDTVRCATSVPELAASLRPKMNILYFARLKNAELGKFLSSSNGIILCGTYKDAYYVVNPVTKRIVSLPPPPKLSAGYEPAMVLVFKENTCNILTPKYKVIAAQGAGTNTLSMEIYSSEIGKWRRSTMSVTENIYLRTTPPLVVNGVIHWFCYDIVYVYDSSGGKNHVQCIKLPGGDANGHANLSSGGISRSSCDDALWYHVHSQKERKERILTFWMLPQNGENDRSYKRSTTIAATKWIRMHTICYDSLFKHAAKILSKHETSKEFNDDSRGATSLLVPCRPNIVHLKVHGRIFIFDLESGTIDKLVAYPGTPIIGHGKDYAEYYCDSYPYLESLTLSSYAL